MMDAEKAGRLRSFLAAHTTLTLATVAPDGLPWAVSLFYAEGSDLSLYFASEETVRHSQNLRANPGVSATIAGDGQPWQKIHGLQLAGKCRLLENSERDPAWEIYAAKFPFVRESGMLAQRLREGGFYRISPAWIRLIDNRREFGFKEELLLSDPPG